MYTLIELQSPRAEFKLDQSQLEFENIAELLDEQKFPPQTEYLQLYQLTVQYFYDRGLTHHINETTLSIYLDFFRQWSKPQRYYYLLKHLADQNKTEIVFTEQLTFLADTLSDLAKRQLEVYEFLRQVKPAIDLSFAGATTAGHFHTQAEIETAITQHKLVALSIKNILIEDFIVESRSQFVLPQLAEIVNRLDEDLPTELQGMITISSATRYLLLQEVLRELGYPAAQISMHTKGAAVDFKLTPRAKQLLNGQLAVKINSMTRCDAILGIIKQGVVPTIANLRDYKLLDTNSIPVLAWEYLSRIKSAVVIDETPFFFEINKSHPDQLILKPVFHLQLK